MDTPQKKQKRLKKKEETPQLNQVLKNTETPHILRKRLKKKRKHFN